MVLKHVVKFVLSLFLFTATLHAQCDTFQAVSAGGAHSLALQSNGTVWAWGSNNFGQLGTGGGDSNVRHQVLNLSNVIAISAGGNFSLALKTDGTVWAWGKNADGELGNGTPNNSSLPTQVIQLTDVKAIAAGDSFALALKNDGTVWAWGSNFSGQLGDGTTFSSNFPVQVVNNDLMVATAIAAGAQFSLAIRSDGKVLAWGRNNNGQLGNGDPLFLNSSVPVFVVDTDLTSASAISAGNGHALAIKNDGSVWAWGLNTNGQLGDGTFTDSNIPVQVVNTFLTNATAISAGSLFSLAIRNDGTVWAWGINAAGELGIGTNTPIEINEPIQTINTNLMSSVASISAGGQFSLARKHDGTLWAWGFNDVGQLGDGTNRPSAEPVAVALAPVVDFISATLGSCDGRPLHIPLSANLPGTLFTWTVVQNGVTGGSDGSGTAIDVVFTLIPPNQFGFAMYTITPSIGSCIGEPVFLYVDVSHNTVVTATPASQTLCSGSLTNIQLSATTGNNFFTWTALSVGVIGASEGCGTSINQTLVATGTTPGTVVYTITQNADAKCPSSPTQNPCINTPIIATVIVEPCGPIPPSNFCGKVKKRKCEKQTDIVHVLTWTPSTDPTVEGYRIYEGDNLIDSVPASGPFKVVIPSRNSKKQYTYSVVAINRFGNESTRLTITLSNKNSKHGNQVCTDCPASPSCK